MVVANTKFNTTIPGMIGYKKEQNFDKMNEAKKIYNDFGWIIKG
jgi:hypothetical protein